MDPHHLSSVSLWICKQWLHLPSDNFPPQWIYTSLLNLHIYANTFQTYHFCRSSWSFLQPIVSLGLSRDCINSASCLLPVPRPVMKGWGPALFSFACLNTSSFILLKYFVTCRERHKHACEHRPTCLFYIFCIFLFYILYRLIQDPCLVEVPTLKTGLEDKLGQLWWREWGSWSRQRRRWWHNITHRRKLHFMVSWWWTEHWLLFKTVQTISIS